MTVQSQCLMLASDRQFKQWSNRSHPEPYDWCENLGVKFCRVKSFVKTRLCADLTSLRLLCDSTPNIGYSIKLMHTETLKAAHCSRSGNQMDYHETVVIQWHVRKDQPQQKAKQGKPLTLSGSIIIERSVSGVSLCGLNQRLSLCWWNKG